MNSLCSIQLYNDKDYKVNKSCNPHSPQSLINNLIPKLKKKSIHPYLDLLIKDEQRDDHPYNLAINSFENLKETLDATISGFGPTVDNFNLRIKQLENGVAVNFKSSL